MFTLLYNPTECFVNIQCRICLKTQKKAFPYHNLQYKFLTLTMSRIRIHLWLLLPFTLINVIMWILDLDRISVLRICFKREIKDELPHVFECASHFWWENKWVLVLVPTQSECTLIIYRLSAYFYCTIKI